MRHILIYAKRSFCAIALPRLPSLACCLAYLPAWSACLARLLGLPACPAPPACLAWPACPACSLLRTEIPLGIFQFVPNTRFNRQLDRCIGRIYRKVCMCVCVCAPCILTRAMCCIRPCFTWQSRVDLIYTMMQECIALTASRCKVLAFITGRLAFMKTKFQGPIRICPALCDIYIFKSRSGIKIFPAKSKSPTVC